jgi:hypothetical protein
MFSKTLFPLLILYFISTNCQGQYAAQDSVYSKLFVGSTFFLLGNLATSNKPDFAQINFGYRLTNKDAISIELKTWKYAWPLGIPYGEGFEAEGLGFPGFIRERGFALVYQRFLWKGLYTGVHTMNAWQTFVNEDGEKFDRGFQIFNTYRVGYHIKLFKDRFFIEPSFAITHRPFHTPMPPSFAQYDNNWPKYFIGEPGLHFGIKF